MSIFSRQLQGRRASGQSSVEFVLIAPVLFFVFFGLLQFFYYAYISFAVQKATNAIAEQAAASVDYQLFDPHFQLITALLPMEQLNSSTLLYSLSSSCDIQEQNNRIMVTVSYPMPIWVPLVGSLLGQSLNGTSGSSAELPVELTQFIQAIGLNLPSTNPFPTTNVAWITFRADALDENSVGASSSS